MSCSAIRFIVGVAPDPSNPETTREEKQRELAREYAGKFCRPEQAVLIQSLFREAADFGLQGGAV
jgi:hypothetical protein